MSQHNHVCPLSLAGRAAAIGTQAASADVQHSAHALRRKGVAVFNSDYSENSFFVSLENLKKLQTISIGFCPKIKQIKKKDVSSETWAGYEYCTVLDGKRPFSVELKKLSQSQINLKFSGNIWLEKTFIVTKDQRDRYRGKSGSVALNLGIDMSRGIIKGKAHETNLAVRAIFAAFLASGICDFYFERK